MRTPRVVLADDHAIVMEGLHRVLEPDFEIVAEVADGRALVAAVEKLRPDIIVVDISMPLLNGIEAVRRIRKTNRELKVIFLTMHPDATYAAEALRAGGSAYVLKSTAGAEIKVAIREALRGRMYVTPSINRAVVQARMAQAGCRDNIENKLTPRQLEVLQLIVEGRSSKEMAEILHVSPRTIEFHKYRVMEALAVRNTAELIQYAMKHRIGPA